MTVRKSARELMAKKKTTKSRSSAQSGNRQSPWALPVVGGILLALVGGVVFIATRRTSNAPAGPASAPAPAATAQQAANTSSITLETSPETQASPEILSMEVATAVMVTAELDFPGTIAEALAQTERKYEPDDGIGRTFAVLDAYGERTPTGKLHISMHVSSEKPGMAALAFKPTGEVLWKSKITSRANAPTAKNLTVYVGDEKGATWIVDGSGGASFILDAKLRDKGILLRDFWPDGAERELTIVYSACGCPVKVKVRRAGERLVRTSDLPVIFPDDPDAVATLAGLMRW
jgi:hypothetical protein